jgi:hypothetical protein
MHIDEFTPHTGRYLQDNNIVSNIIELVTGAVKGIDSDHSYIHEGRLYQSDITQSLSATNGTYAISIKTAEDGYTHYRPSTIIASADKLTVSLYEGATVTGGTDLDATNHNRLSANISGNTLKKGVTVTDAGTLLEQVYLAGTVGTGQLRSGSSLGAGINEWVLKQDTTYLIQLSNASDSANIVHMNIFWYEEDKGVIGDEIES